MKNTDVNAIYETCYGSQFDSSKVRQAIKDANDYLKRFKVEGIMVVMGTLPVKTWKEETGYEGALAWNGNDLLTIQKCWDIKDGEVKYYVLNALSLANVDMGAWNYFDAPEL